MRIFFNTKFVAILLAGILLAAGAHALAWGGEGDSGPGDADAGSASGPSGGAGAGSGGGGSPGDADVSGAPGPSSDAGPAGQASPSIGHSDGNSGSPTDSTATEPAFGFGVTNNDPTDTAAGVAPLTEPEIGLIDSFSQTISVVGVGFQNYSIFTAYISHLNPPNTVYGIESLSMSTDHNPEYDIVGGSHSHGGVRGGEAVDNLSESNESSNPDSGDNQDVGGFAYSGFGGSSCPCGGNWYGAEGAWQCNVCSLAASVDLRVNGQDGLVSVEAGEEVTLSWNTERAYQCRPAGTYGPYKFSLHGDIKRGSDSFLTTPTQAGNYTFALECDNVDGRSARDNVRVVVTASPAEAQPDASAPTEEQQTEHAPTQTSDAGPVLLSDLQVTKLIVPSEEAGTQVHVQVTVVNNGTKEAPATTLGFRGHGGISCNTNAERTVTIPALAPGASHDSTFTYTLPSTPNNYQAIAMADYSCAITPELHDDNNKRTHKYVANAQAAPSAPTPPQETNTPADSDAAQPALGANEPAPTPTVLSDLVVTSLQVPDGVPGQQRVVSVTVRNIGDAVAPATTLGFRGHGGISCNTNAERTLAVPSLSPNRSHVVSFTYILPANANTYSATAMADYSCIISPEKSDANNKATYTYHVVEPAPVIEQHPDLTVTELSVPDAEARTQVQVRVSVMNAGTASAPPTVLGFRGSGGLSCNANADRTVSVPALNPGQAHTNTFTYTVPSAPNTYTATAMADYTCIVGPETSDANNKRTDNYAVTAPPVVEQHPDLTATDVMIPAGPYHVGSPIIFRGSISNDGGANASAPFDNGLRVFLPGETTPSGLVRATEGAGHPLGTERSYNASYTPTRTGEYRVRFCADVGNRVAESNENNQCSVIKTFTVTETPAPTYPDLTAENIRVNTGSLVQGDSVQFKGTVRNSGSAATGNNFNDRYRYRWNSGNWQLLNHVNNRPLAANDSESVATTFTALSQAGTLEIQLCADNSSGSSVINESHEGNNCTTQTFTIAAPAQSTWLPDLTAENIRVNTGTLTVGDSTQFKGTVRNLGTKGTGVNFLNRYRYRWNGGAWQVLNYPANRPMAADDLESVATTFITLQAGTLELELCVDLNSQGSGVITEANENNNCTTRTFAISQQSSSLNQESFFVELMRQLGAAFFFRENKK